MPRNGLHRRRERAGRTDVSNSERSGRCTEEIGSLRTPMVNWKVRPVVDSRAVTTPDRTSTPVTRQQDGAWARVGALPAPAARQQPTRIATLIRATRLTAIRFMDLVPVDDPNLVRVLKPGQAVGADFQTGVAWVPPGATRYRIVSAGPAPSPGTMGGGLKP